MNNTPWFFIATVVLAILKLTGAIAISWFWVFAPMGFSILLALILFLIAGTALVARN